MQAGQTAPEQHIDIPGLHVEHKPDEKELTVEQKEKFTQQSPLKDIKTSSDFDKLDLSKYKWNLMNYQGTGYYLNKETGERIDVERSFGVGGYKNLKIAYTKDGITHEITFDDNGQVKSEEVKKSGDLPVIPKTTPKEQPKIEVRNEAQSQVTKLNNKVTYFKDNKGNTVIRVDYQNNDGENFDEEEVRSADGKIVSFSKVMFTEGKKERLVEKYEYDENQNLVSVTETCYDSSGKKLSTKNIPPEEKPNLIAHVHIGVPVDGEWGDPELKKIIQALGGGIIGQD
jgi:hypothetical protein